MEGCAVTGVGVGDGAATGGDAATGGVVGVATGGVVGAASSDAGGFAVEIGGDGLSLISVVVPALGNSQARQVPPTTSWRLPGAFESSGAADAWATGRAGTRTTGGSRATTPGAGSSGLMTEGAEMTGRGAAGQLHGSANREDSGGSGRERQDGGGEMPEYQGHRTEFSLRRERFASLNRGFLLPYPGALPRGTRSRRVQARI